MNEALRSRTAFAKTTPPAIANAIRRETLFSRLDGSPGRTVAWISGPAGAGKTTLAASYVEARGYRSAWYQVDRDDEDVATFFHYLQHAVRDFHGAPFRAPPRDDLPLVDVAALSRNCFRAIFSRVAEPCVLVLDDLHPLARDGSLLQALEAGLAQVPRHCCVIVTSRVEPPPGFARMRAARQMICVGWDELRLSRAEVGEVAGLRGHSLTPDAADALLERTQGWAAGLVVMLEHAKLAGGLGEVSQGTAPQLLFDYFAGEIFERFEPQTREFLLRVACLPRMTIEVAQRLSGSSQAGRLLANLALNDYFVREAVGESARLYEIHPLMREFLLSRAAADLPQAVDAEARRRSAALLLDAGQIEDAVSLFVECGDWPQVARLAASQAPTMLGEGRHQTLRRWIEMLPADLVDRNAALLQALAESSLLVSPRTARYRFDQACRVQEELRDAGGAVRAICGAIDAAVLEFDDLSVIDPWLDKLASLAAGSEAARGALARTEALATRMRACALRGRGPLAAPVDLPRSDAGSKPDALVHVLLALLRGDFAEADGRLDLIAPGELGAGMRVALDLTTSFRHWLDGAFEPGLLAARAGLAEANGGGIHGLDVWLRLLVAACSVGLGRVEEARGELDALETGDAELRRGDRSMVKYLRAWIAGHDGDMSAAGRLAQTTVRLAAESGLLWLECLARLWAAQAASASKDRASAEAQLRVAAAHAERLDSPLLGCSVRTVLASTALAAGDAAGAMADLSAALALVRERGYRHVVGARPHSVGELCAVALEHEVESEAARALVRSGSLPPPAAAHRLRQWPWPFEMTFFGGFELMRSSQPVEFPAKGAGRPVDLLKLLAAHGGRKVRREVVADALWPHSEADFALQSFNQTLHRLRRNILESNDALTLREGSLSLNPSLFWLDTWALELRLEDLEARLREPRADPAVLLAALEAALGIYRGPFLPDESEPAICIGFREHVRGRLLRCVGGVAGRLADAGQHEAAFDCLARLIDRDPTFEAPYRKLMECHLRRGSHADGVAVYERLRSRLAGHSRAFPSPETQSVYGRLRAAAGTA